MSNIHITSHHIFSHFRNRITRSPHAPTLSFHTASEVTMNEPKSGQIPQTTTAPLMKRARKIHRSEHSNARAAWIRTCTVQVTTQYQSLQFWVMFDKETKHFNISTFKLVHNLFSLCRTATPGYQVHSKIHRCCFLPLCLTLFMHSHGGWILPRTVHCHAHGDHRVRDMILGNDVPRATDPATNVLLEV